MGLKEVLEKMKLVELEATEAPAPAATRAPMGSPPPPPRPGAARPPAMADVLKAAPPRPALDEAVLGKAIRKGGHDVPDFDSIYQAAGVKVPVHGYTAYKVLEFFSSEHLAALDPRAKAAALAGFLKMNPSGPVPLADVIQDAVARDQALDGFEEFLRKKLDQKRQELEKDNAQLQAEIDEVTQRNKEKMDGNRRTLEEEKERLTTWQARKRIEERRLFDAVAPFVEQNPVSVGGSSAAPAAPAPAKPGEGA